MRRLRALLVCAIAGLVSGCADSGDPYVIPLPIRAAPVVAPAPIAAPAVPAASVPPVTVRIPVARIEPAVSPPEGEESEADFLTGALPDPGARFRSVRDVPWWNMTYGAADDPQYRPRVRGGRWEVSSGNGEAQMLLVSSVQYADLTGDGAEEAVALTIQNGCGWDGPTPTILVYGLRDGELERVASIDAASDDPRRWDEWRGSVQVRGSTIVVRNPGATTRVSFRWNGAALEQVAAPRS